MVLGCYYLTAEDPQATKGQGRRFGNLEDAIKAYEQGQVDLHAHVWLRYDDEVVTEEPDMEVIESEKLADGSTIEYYRQRFVRRSAEGEQIAQFIDTTIGRIIYNKTVQDALTATV